MNEFYEAVEELKKEIYEEKMNKRQRKKAIYEELRNWKLFKWLLELLDG